MMVPSWGFSLAVSGRTMPLLVISSLALGLMTTRSPSGRSLVDVAVAVANVHSSCDGQSRPPGVDCGIVGRPDRAGSNVPGPRCRHRDLLVDWSSRLTG